MDRPVPAKLVVIGGALAGDVFPLEQDETTLGREASNTIALSDGSLSRRHCGFTWESGQWHLRDLGSSNGTFVNGVQVSSHPLTKGDRITAGGSVLLYVPHSILSASLSRADLHSDHPLPATSRVALESAAYLSPATESASQPAASVERGLRTLLAISAAINAIREEDALHAKLLELLFEAVPSGHGAILLHGTNQEFVVQLVRPAQLQGVVTINGATVRRALQEQSGIVSVDPDSQSPSSPPGTGSIMTVPIAVQQRSLGAIYLASQPGVIFTEDHLQLVTAAGRFAATALENVRRLAALERDTDRLHSDLQLVHKMVGQSVAVRDVYTRIAKIARVDTTVLITGETGTGKELCARAIHLNSPRARRPFVAINCAALAESLLESELFGHERGAFTGAFAQKKGKLEIANGGTILLDEVGELALPLQSKLLRVLQERELERVGGTHPVKLNLRILAATNRNLAEDVAAGRFRQDLFYRLNVVGIELPPVRERRDDVPLLARHFASIYAERISRPVKGVSTEAMRALVRYDWPGNVRELENAIERAIVLGASDEVLLEDLPETLIETAGITRAHDGETLHAQVLDVKREAVINAHRRAGGNFTEAAKLLGVHPNYLHRLIRNLDVRKVLERTEA